MDTGLRVNRLFAITLPALMLIMNLSTVAVLWLGAYRVNSGDMPIGNLTAFLQYISLILFSIMTAVSCSSWSRAAGSRPSRIQEVLETEPPIWDPATPISPDPRAATSSSATSSSATPAPRSPCSATSRSRPTRARPRRSSGHTGSGKSTLINLLPRFYDATGGAVLIDGVDVKEHGPPGPVVPDRHRAPEGVPVRRHDRQQPALRRPGRDRRRPVAGARHRAGPRVRRGDGGRARQPDRPGRHQRLRRPAPAARHRARPGQEARHLRLRRQLLGARLPDRRAAARRARAGAGATRR